ncbi:MAG: phosphoglucosamine mutase [Eubacteriales bacterium]
MGKLFGTDGVRGIANSELTPELAFNLGKAGAYVLKKEDERPIVLIGKDTRISGDMLEDAISAGILAMGGNVIKVGVLPTPAIAYLVKHYKATAGIVISASHNSFEYNGIKFFGSEGFKLDDELEEQIEDILIRNIDVNSHITGEKLGRSLEAEDNALDLYSEFLKSTINISLEDFRIVLDCANGAAYKVAEKVFKELGARVFVIGNEPNGLNINESCGSTHPKMLAKAVLTHHADLGLAFDGDADRLIAVDEKGRILDGDKTILICAKLLKKTGKLAKNLITATVMSNIGFHKEAENMGAEVEVTQVGDRYVLESMRKTGSIIGGEQSGHIIFLDHTTTGDGILSGLQLMNAVAYEKRKLSELADEIKIFPQVLKNASVKNENKKKYMLDEEVRSEIESIEELMSGEGRVLVRASGTEPLVRVMLEGADIDYITKLAEKLALLITKKFG